ncbi:hypothetical protein ED28_15215 [[Pantoea] beijingensis]|uniref:K(+)-transporting ATPase subunit F n=1 Tax=[Pantoea] beijingensis TaxID=1324864 RepID=A0A443IAT4_9GAMM|nr:hypothetical protein ED28_15215 [[Pantoea] beijingensis]
MNIVCNLYTMIRRSLSFYYSSDQVFAHLKTSIDCNRNLITFLLKKTYRINNSPIFTLFLYPPRRFIHPLSTRLFTLYASESFCWRCNVSIEIITGIALVALLTGYLCYALIFAEAF